MGRTDRIYERKRRSTNAPVYSVAHTPTHDGPCLASSVMLCFLFCVVLVCVCFFRRNRKEAEKVIVAALHERLEPPPEGHEGQRRRLVKKWARIEEEEADKKSMWQVPNFILLITAVWFPSFWG